jgi:hypothetical protein
LDPDAVYSYGLDGFTPSTSETTQNGDPQDAIDLESLADEVYRLLRREAYIERERRG